MTMSRAYTPKSFVVGMTYSRASVQKALGGDLQSYLLTRNRQVTCVCLSLNLNPKGSGSNPRG